MPQLWTVRVVISIMLTTARGISASPICRFQEDNSSPLVVSNGTEIGIRMEDFNRSSQNLTGWNMTTDCNNTDKAHAVSLESTTSARPVLPWLATFNRFEFVSRGIYFPIVLVLSIVGNVVSVSILRKDVLNSSSTVYLFALALTDLAFAIVFAPTVCRAFEAVKAMRSFQSFYAYYVVYFFPLVNLFHTTAVYVTLSFTVERFIAVVFPVPAQRFSTRFRARVAVSCALGFAIILNAVRFFRRVVIEKTDHVNNEIYYTYTLSSIGQDERREMALFWAYFLATKVIPFPVLVVLNSVVVWQIWRARWNRQKMTLKDNSRPESKMSPENQITLMMVCIVTAFLICNAAAGGGSLYIALYGMEALYKTQDPVVFYMFGIGEVLVSTNPLVNCILYVACSQTMRTEMLALVSCKRKLDRQPSFRSPVTQETDIQRETY